jgi:hypothetical protein
MDAEGGIEEVTTVVMVAVVILGEVMGAVTVTKGGGQEEEGLHQGLRLPRNHLSRRRVSVTDRVT